MPCDTVQTNTVSLGKMAPSLLASACKRAGWGHEVIYQGRVLVTVDGVRVAIEEGRLEAVGLSAARAAAVASAIKRAYSAEVVRYTARAHGWAVKEVGVGRFEVLKGGA